MQIHEIKQNRFFYGMLYSNFLSQNIKIWFLAYKLSTRHQIQAFQGFSWSFLIC